MSELQAQPIGELLDMATTLSNMSKLQAQSMEVDYYCSQWRSCSLASFISNTRSCVSRQIGSNSSGYYSWLSDDTLKSWFLKQAAFLSTAQCCNSIFVKLVHYICESKYIPGNTSNHKYFFWAS